VATVGTDDDTAAPWSHLGVQCRWWSSDAVMMLYGSAASAHHGSAGVTLP
jgi:hypothetical protein